MTQTKDENEQQSFISLSGFRQSKLQFNQIPYRFLEANYDIQINKNSCFLESVVYNYGYKDMLVLERVLRLS